MKILITGAAGMLGHQCFIKLGSHFGAQNVAGTLRKKRDHYASHGIFRKSTVYDQLNLCEFSKVEKVLQTFRPDVIVNCVGLTLRKPEMKDLEKTVEINSMLPHRLAKWVAANNARLIHFSTDCVFSGAKGNYTEQDIPDADDMYGKSKFLGEVSDLNALTLRLSIVGRELEGRTELIEWFLAQKGKSISGYSEAMYSGLTTNVVASEVVRLIEKYPRLSGVYQVSSEPISKFDLLALVNQEYQRGVEIGKNPDYRSNKILDCQKYIYETGFQMPSWKNMIQQMRQDEMKNKESVNYGS